MPHVLAPLWQDEAHPATTSEKRLKPFSNSSSSRPCAQVDAEGNVNVTRLGGELMPGCGAFVDLSQTAKKVVFVGTLTSGGLQASAD